MYGKLKASDQRTLNTSVASKCIPQTFQSPSHGNLEVLKKSPEKPGEWDLKPGDFKNMRQIKKKKKTLFVWVFFTFLVPPVVFFYCFFHSQVLDNK